MNLRIFTPLKSSPSPTELPSSSRQHKHTCALWHFPPSVSHFFPPSLLFPSFLSFPCFLSWLSLSLQLDFIIYYDSLPPSFFDPPPPPSCAPYPHSLSFLLKRSPQHSPASLTGTEKTSELTPVAAISVHLLGSDGVELQVNGPITVSVPLPADSGLKENDHVPAWRFDPRLGMY